MPFILYRSSAGSGKTFTLVREFLKIVLKKPADFSHILAITFTNKAAAEMKDRILSSLYQLSTFLDEPGQVSTSRLMELLCGDLQLDPPAVSCRASEALTKVLHRYSDLVVTTIDSFMHRIIRTFAFDLHLPLDFEVELEQDLLIEQAVQNLVGKAGRDEKLTRALVQYILYKTENDRGWNIETDLIQTGTTLFRERGQLALEVLAAHGLDMDRFFAINHQLGDERKAFINKLKNIGKQAVDLMTLAGLDPADFYQGKSGIGVYFMHAAAGNLDKLPPKARVLETIGEDRWYAKNADPGVKRKIDGIRENLASIYQQISRLHEKEYPVILTYGLLERSLLPLAVLTHLHQELAQIKRDNRLLPIGEFNQTILNTVRAEPVPFIFERLGEWYRHYLLDEFQDTSVMQWINLLPLVENALSEGSDTILVGDGKQAIYRWRNGDVEQFSRLPEIFMPMLSGIPEDKKQVLRDHYREFTLARNFRSLEQVVEFNNRFFNFARSILPGSLGKIYENLSQEPLPGNHGGYVSVEFLSLKDKEDGVSDLHLERVTEIIRKCLSDGYPAGDIAILCRTNVQGSRVAQHLISEGLDVTSSESLLLKNSPAVNALVAALRVVANPDDRISREVLTAFSRLYSPVRPETFRNLGSAYRGIILFSLAERLVRELGLACKADPFVIFFLDLVHQYASGQDGTVAGFLAWWDENGEKLSIRIPDEVDAVRVMTVHKAKGLEYEVVIYPFVNDKLSPKPGDHWVDFTLPAIPDWTTSLVYLAKKRMEGSTLFGAYEEEEAKNRLDVLNVLYVALTRARERLYVILDAPSKKDAKPNNIPELFASYLASCGINPLANPRYELGRETPAAAGRKAGGNLTALRELISTEWSSRVRIRQHHPENWDVTAPERQRSFGNLVQQCLSEIHTAVDLPEILASGRYASLPADVLAGLEAKLHSLLTDPGLAFLFSREAGVRNEAEILTPGGQSYRPDRLVIYPGRTLLADYKTGKPHPGHDSQLTNYAELLREMGYPGVESWLVYLDGEHRLRRVS